MNLSVKTSKLLNWQPKTKLQKSLARYVEWLNLDKTF